MASLVQQDKKGQERARENLALPYASTTNMSLVTMGRLTESLNNGESDVVHC